jgi:hypothetical protein
MFHTSIYTNIVVTFLRPMKVDLETYVPIVGDFGVALRLHTNLTKFSLYRGIVDTYVMEGPSRR